MRKWEVGVSCSFSQVGAQPLGEFLQFSHANSAGKQWICNVCPCGENAYGCTEQSAWATTDPQCT